MNSVGTSLDGSPWNADTAAKRARLYQQLLEATESNPKVTCGCGRRLPLRLLYRCLYCGIFFCQPCAEDHFGKTRVQYLQEEAILQC